MSIYNRSDLLRGFINDEFPVQKFGDERQKAASEIAAVLAGIKPTEDDRLLAALGHFGPVTYRVAAYDKGLRWFKSAYYGYSDTFNTLDT